MTQLRQLQLKTCGYRGYNQKRNGSVIDNIQKIQFRKLLFNNFGVIISECQFQNFKQKAIEVPSIYNPPTIKTILTPYNDRYYTISNIHFGNKKIQFIAVDGNYLTEDQMNDPDYVISQLNSGKLQPFSIKLDLNNKQNTLSLSEMTKIDAYAGSIWYCLFLFDIFGRVGIIDQDMVFLSVVNVNMANAFWNSHYMTYGNGIENGKQFMKPLTSIDIVGHEAGHGIIEASGGLTYQGESGALNESIADIFGTCLEKYYDIHNNLQLFDWKIGEDCVDNALRSMSNPKQHQQPTTYLKEHWIDPNSNFDNGGVHINSGINNYLFYILVTSAKGINDNGTEFLIPKSFDIFSLAKFIYCSLFGTNGCQKINTDCNYQQYSTCLLNNCQQFLHENQLDKELSIALYEGFVAIGLKSKLVNDTNPTNNNSTDSHNIPTQSIILLKMDLTNFRQKYFSVCGKHYYSSSGITLFDTTQIIGNFNFGQNVPDPKMHLLIYNPQQPIDIIFKVGQKTYKQQCPSSHQFNFIWVRVNLPLDYSTNVIITIRPIQLSESIDMIKIKQIVFSSG